MNEKEMKNPIDKRLLVIKRLLRSRVVIEIYHFDLYSKTVIKTQYSRCLAGFRESSPRGVVRPSEYKCYGNCLKLLERFHDVDWNKLAVQPENTIACFMNRGLEEFLQQYSSSDRIWLDDGRLPSTWTEETKKELEMVVENWEQEIEQFKSGQIEKNTWDSDEVISKRVEQLELKSQQKRELKIRNREEEEQKRQAASEE